jgi:hypothetical protein
MARINPDPYAGGHLFALVDRVTGLIHTSGEDHLMETVRALEEGGVATDDIDIFMGEQGAKCLDLQGREHGFAVRLLRTLEHAVGTEAECHHRIDAALRQGASLLCVRIHKKKSDERARALKVLQALHAHELHYWGQWSFEDLPSA